MMAEWKEIEKVVHIGGDDSGFIAVSEIPDVTVNMNKKPIGYICITENVKIAVYKPISRFHKLMMKVFFGWKWEGAEDDKRRSNRDIQAFKGKCSE